MSLLRLPILLASLILFATSSAGAEGGNPASEVSPNLVSLTSCSESEHNESYRVVIFNRGFEHVSSEVYLQWLDWREDGPHLVKSTLIAELSSGMWSVGSLSVIPGKRCSMRLNATHTYSAESAEFDIRPIGLGRYSIRNSAAGPSGK